MNVRDGNHSPKGYEKITGLSVAKSLTVPVGARYALIKAETQAIRWRDDGVDPDTDNGMLVDVGDEFLYTGKLSRLRLIEDTASATAHVSYYA